MKKLLIAAIIATLGLWGFTWNKTEEKKNVDLSLIKLPPGFHISIFAADVPHARSMTLGANGTVFVGNRDGEEVYALVDADHDGVAEKKYVVLKGYKTPNGVAFHNGALYVAQIDKIWRLDNIETHLAEPPKPVLIFDSLPHDDHHGWKYIAFGPDGKLYIPIGAPCNVCDNTEKDPRYASITRINSNGTGFEIYASGVRNTVGFDWSPVNKELWFTDNGRDWLGDDSPPDELNHAPHAGMNFGFPFCEGGDIKDPDFGDKHPCSDFTPPVVKLGPGNMFPSKYHNQIFIAEHGSWNRSVPIGYRITSVRFNEAGKTVYEPFAQGWLQNGKAWGRPVDVLVMKDGSMLVSDDMAGVIYRITYDGK
jgi:glucose/arabinose dehydrogenase